MRRIVDFFHFRLQEIILAGLGFFHTLISFSWSEVFWNSCNFDFEIMRNHPCRDWILSYTDFLFLVWGVRASRAAEASAQISDRGGLDGGSAADQKDEVQPAGRLRNAQDLASPLAFLIRFQRQGPNIS